VSKAEQSQILKKLIIKKEINIYERI